VMVLPLLQTTLDETYQMEYEVQRLMLLEVRSRNLSAFATRHDEPRRGGNMSAQGNALGRP